VLRHDDDTRPKDDHDRRHVRHYDTADGMVKVVAVLHPEEAALVLAAIERVAIERCRERDADEGRDDASVTSASTSVTPAAVATNSDVTQGSPEAPEKDLAHGAPLPSTDASAETRRPPSCSSHQPTPPN
jgi:hypothetical protein